MCCFEHLSSAQRAARSGYIPLVDPILPRCDAIETALSNLTYNIKKGAPKFIPPNKDSVDHRPGGIMLANNNAPQLIGQLVDNEVDDYRQTTQFINQPSHREKHLRHTLHNHNPQAQSPNAPPPKLPLGFELLWTKHEASPRLASLRVAERLRVGV